MEKKLIYILNHYSDHSAQHFYHVVYLLEKMADRNVKIVLVIEKCEGKLWHSRKKININGYWS